MDGMFCIARYRRMATLWREGQLFNPLDPSFDTKYAAEGMANVANTMHREQEDLVRKIQEGNSNA